MTLIVLVIDKASGVHVQVPNVLNSGIDSHNVESERTRARLRGGVAVQSARDVLYQRNDVRNHLDVFLRKVNRHTCLIAAGLLRSASGIDSDRGRSVTVPNRLNSVTKALAIGEQQHNRSDA